MADCHKCKYETSAECVPRSQKLGFPNCYQSTITNYNRIISKSPEELAIFLSDVVDCGVCEEMHGFRMCDAAPDKACEDCWAGWLRQEAEEGE